MIRTEKPLIKDFPINPKWEMAIKRLRAFEPPEGYYLAFSGGKDSITVYDLLIKSGCKFDAHFQFTTVDPPELLKFIRENYPSVEWHRPEKSMFQLIIENGVPPTRRIRYCCKELKEGGGGGRRVITGIRWAESIRRSKRMMTENCQKDASKIFLHPIIDWSDDEVWEYIRYHKIPYCNVYDEGYSRIGCILCPMKTISGKEQDIKRYPRFYRAYIRAFARMLVRLEEEGKPIFYSGKTGQDVMDWWVYETHNEPGQVTLYDN